MRIKLPFVFLALFSFAVLATPPKEKPAPSGQSGVSLDVRIDGHQLEGITVVHPDLKPGDLPAGELVIGAKVDNKPPAASAAWLIPWLQSKKPARTMSIAVHLGGALLGACAFQNVSVRSVPQPGAKVGVFTMPPGHSGMLLAYSRGQCFDFVNFYSGGSAVSHGRPVANIQQARPTHGEPDGRAAADNDTGLVPVAKQP
jgi:hypothetical protein